MLLLFSCLFLVPAQTFQIQARQSRFLAAFFDKIQRERATERQTGINDLDLLAITAGDCLRDLVDCFITPIADDPTDPLILAAVGTTIFSGGLIAQSALNPRTVVVVDREQTSTYLPILIEDDNTEEKEEGEQVSITISSGESQAGSEDGAYDNIDTNVVVIGREAVNEESDRKDTEKNNRRGIEEKPKRKGNKAQSGQKIQRSREKHNQGKQKHKGNKHSKNKKKTNKEKRRKGETKRSQQNTSDKRDEAKIDSESSIKRNTTTDLASAIASAITDSLGTRAGDLLEGVSNEDSLSLRAPQGRRVAGAGDAWDLQVLRSFPHCGGSTSRHPWLGTFYIGEEELATVALLSMTTRQFPDRPTILVTSGNFMESDSISAESLAAKGEAAEVRLGDTGRRVGLPVLSVTRHPGFAPTLCAREPCGPARYNNGKDVAVIHVDPTALWEEGDTEHIYPICLPEEGKGSALDTRLGWWEEGGGNLVPGDEASGGGEGPQRPSPRLVEEEECGVVTGNAGGKYRVAEGTICHSGGAGGEGDMLLSTGDHPATLLAIGQRPLDWLPRWEQGQGTRLACVLGWVAQQHSLRWQGGSKAC